MPLNRIAHAGPALGKGMRLLEALSVTGRPATVQTLAVAAGLPVATAYRLLQQLQRLDYVTKSAATAQYALGPRFYRLLGDALSHLEVRRLVRPVMVELAAATQETVHLAVAAGLSIVTVEVIESPRLVATRHPLGKELPVHATAIGQVFLAFDAPFARALEEGRLPLPPLTPHTITDAEALKRRVARVRRQGFATNLGQRDPESSGAAAPVHDPAGRLMAAVAVSAPRSRLRTERALVRLGRLIQQTIATHAPFAPALDAPPAVQGSQGP